MAKKKTTKKKATAKKTATKKKVTKKTTKKAAKKAPAKKSTKKAAAKKTAKKAAAKTTKKTEKTAAKSASKKTASKKTAKKTASSKTAKTKTASTSKKTTEKAAPKKSAKSKNQPRFSIKIGSKKPLLAMAPGVKISNGENGKNKERKEEQEIRKLSKKEVREIRALLEEKRDELLYGIRKELADSRQRSMNLSADPMDKATDSSDDDLSFEIAAASDEELEEIDAALDKIENGTYGSCEGCGCTISPSRLKILPFATHCRDCRENKEKRNRRDIAVNAFLGDDANNEDNE